MTRSRIVNTLLPAFFHLSLMLAVFKPHYALAQDIHVVNTASYAGSGRYDWTIHILAEESVLNAIDRVEYTLHPSFPNPVRVVDNRENNFALTSNGWGEFNVFIRVIFTDGSERYLKHRLSLEERSEEEIEVRPHSSHEYGEITAANTARYLGDRGWEWTIFIETDQETQSQIERVDYTLHPTFPEPERSVSTRHNNFALTARGGGTFEIKIRIVFKDDSERFLTHMLQFEKTLE